jgi:hypothetical protein
MVVMKFESVSTVPVHVNEFAAICHSLVFCFNFKFGNAKHRENPPSRQEGDSGRGREGNCGHLVRHAGVLVCALLLACITCTTDIKMFLHVNLTISMRGYFRRSANDTPRPPKNINFRIEGAKFMKMYGLQMASRDQQG